MNSANGIAIPQGWQLPALGLRVLALPTIAIGILPACISESFGYHPRIASMDAVFGEQAGQPDRLPAWFFDRYNVGCVSGNLARCGMVRRPVTLVFAFIMQILMNLRVFRLIVALLLVPFNTCIAKGDGDNAVYKSTDNGRSWVRSDQGIPDNSRVNAFVSLGDNLFAGTDAGIFVSQDEAQTWQHVTGESVTSVRITCFATVGDKVFAGTSDRGLLTSTNNGKSWTHNATFPSRKVRCLLSHDGRLYVGTDTDGVLVSNDSHQEWSRLTQSFPDGAQVFALSIVRGRVFAGLYSKGLYTWSENELRWLNMGTVSPLVLAGINGRLVAGHNPGGIHWSADNGATWSRAAATVKSEAFSSTAPVWELAASEDLVIAGTAEGIYLSEDFGRTWFRAGTGLPFKCTGVSFLLEKRFVLAGTTVSRVHGEQSHATEPAVGPVLKSTHLAPAR